MEVVNFPLALVRLFSNQYIEVLKKNAVECGERTLLAFSDRRGMATGACTWNGCK